ncbi:zinc finger protein 862-like isoform X2 [Leptinotarsa decemlineata]|uniref:zinc finger protein 862-like isoform X2 n=1 Tax=Leptinotarsa decemlineata TaxID=7539 RepID=UPI003D304E5C
MSLFPIYVFIAGWLAPDVTNNTLATCKYCHVVLKAHKKDLVSHAKTEKHEKAVAWDRSAKGCKSISEIYKPVLPESTKIAELKIAAFIAEHCSLLTVDHLINILPQLDPSSEALKNIKLHRTKCSMLIKNVLAPLMREALIEEIGNYPYSIIIDESTDLSTQKVLCIMLRFFSHTTKQVVTTFYRIIKIIECDAKSLHQAIINQLKKDGLKIENMIGIGVDGANIMVGKHNSVTALLKRDLPDLIVVKCVSHSLHLCAEKAAESLPRQLEFLVRETHNWFSYSPKRLDYYKTLYESMNYNKDPKKIPGLSGTRWLARYQAVNTILEQWDELKLLFSIAKSDDKCYMAEQVYDIMRRTPFKALLIFLRNELKNVTQLNLLFQSDNVEPTKLFEDLLLLYKNMLRRLVVPSQLEKLVDSELVEFNFREHLMHTASIYFGFDFQTVSQELEEQDLLDVRERCKNFLICFAEQIQKRLPDNLSMLKTVADLHPKVATSQVKPDLKQILSHIHRTHIYDNKNDIEFEWQQLSNKTWTNTCTSAGLYYEVYNDLDAAGCKRFENIGKFGLAFVTIPISNATVERAFSIYNIIKNKLRNRLSIEMLQSIMMVRFTLIRNGGSCSTFNPSSKMLRLCNVNIYDFKNVDSSEDIDVIYNVLDNL